MNLKKIFGCTYNIVSAGRASVNIIRGFVNTVRGAVMSVREFVKTFSVPVKRVRGSVNAVREAVMTVRGSVKTVSMTVNAVRQAVKGGREDFITVKELVKGFRTDFMNATKVFYLRKEVFKKNSAIKEKAASVVETASLFIIVFQCC